MKGVRRKRTPHTGFADLMNSTDPSTIPHGVITGVAHSAKPIAAKSPPSSNPDDWDVLLKSPPKRRASPQKPIVPSTVSLKDPKESSEPQQTTTSTTATSSTTVPAFLSGWDGADGWGDDPSLEGSDKDLDEDAWGAWPIVDSNADDIVAAPAEDELPVSTSFDISTECPVEPPSFEEKPTTEVLQQPAQETWGAWDDMDDKANDPLSVEPAQTMAETHAEQNLSEDFPAKHAVWEEPPVPVVTYKMLEPAEEAPTTLNDDNLHEDGEDRDARGGDWGVFDDQAEYSSQPQPRVNAANPPWTEEKNDLSQPEPSAEVGEEGITLGSPPVDGCFVRTPETAIASADAWNGWNNLPAEDSETATSTNFTRNTLEALPPGADASASVPQQDNNEVEESSHFVQKSESTVDESTFVADSEAATEYTAVQSSVAVDPNGDADVEDMWGEWDMGVEEQKDDVVSDIVNETQVVQESIHVEPKTSISNVGTTSTETVASPLGPPAIEKLVSAPPSKPVVSSENALTTDAHPTQPVAGYLGERDDGTHSVNSAKPHTTTTSQALSGEVSPYTTQAAISTTDREFKAGNIKPSKEEAYLVEVPIESPCFDEGFHAQSAQTDADTWVDWDSMGTRRASLGVPAVSSVNGDKFAPAQATQTSLEHREYFPFLEPSTNLDRTASFENASPEGIATNTSSADRSAVEQEQGQGTKRETEDSHSRRFFDATEHSRDNEREDKQQTVTWENNGGLIGRTLSTRATEIAEGEPRQELTNNTKEEIGHAYDGDESHAEIDVIATRADSSLADGMRFVVNDSHTPVASLWDWEGESQRVETSLKPENERRDGLGSNISQNDGIRSQSAQEQPVVTNQNDPLAAASERNEERTIAHALTRNASHARAESSSEIVNSGHKQLRTRDEDGCGAEIRSTDVDVSSTNAEMDVPSVAALSSNEDGKWDFDQVHTSYQPPSDLYSSREQVHISSVENPILEGFASAENRSQIEQTEEGGLFESFLPARSAHGNGERRALTNSNIRTWGHSNDPNYTPDADLKHIYTENKIISAAHSLANVNDDQSPVVLREEYGNISNSLSNQHIDTTASSLSNENDKGSINQNQNNAETRGSAESIFQQNANGHEFANMEDIATSFAIDEEWSREDGRTEFDVPQIVESCQTAATTKSTENDIDSYGHIDPLQHLPHSHSNNAGELVMNATVTQHYSSEVPAKISSPVSESWKDQSTEAQFIGFYSSAPPENGSEPSAENQHDSSRYNVCDGVYWKTSELHFSSDINAQSEGGHYMDTHEISKYAPKRIGATPPRSEFSSNAGKMTTEGFVQKDEEEQSGISLHDDETPAHQSAVLDSFQPTAFSNVNQHEGRSLFERNVGQKADLFDNKVPFDSHFDRDNCGRGGFASTQGSVLVQRDALSIDANDPPKSRAESEQSQLQEPSNHMPGSFPSSFSEKARRETEIEDRTPVSQNTGHIPYAPTRSGRESFSEQNTYSEGSGDNSETMFNGEYGVDTKYFVQPSAPNHDMEEGDLTFGGNTAGEGREVSIPTGSSPFVHAPARGSTGTLDAQAGNLGEAVHTQDASLSAARGSAVELEGDLMRGEAANEKDIGLDASLITAEVHAFLEQAPLKVTTSSSQNLHGERKDSAMHNAVHNVPNADNGQRPLLGQNEEFPVQENPQITVGSMFAEPSSECYAPRSQSDGRMQQSISTQYAQFAPRANLVNKDRDNNVHDSHFAQHAFKPGSGFGGMTSTGGEEGSWQNSAVRFLPPVTPHGPLMSVEPNTVGTCLDAGYSPSKRILSSEPAISASDTNNDKIFTFNASDSLFNSDPPETAVDSNIYSYPFSIMDALPSGGMEYRAPRPIISWGFGGTLVTFFPGSNRMDQYQPDKLHYKPRQGTYPVCLHDVNAITGDTGDEDLISVTEVMSPFIFPIRSSDLAALSDMCERIANKLGVGKTKQSESSSALWRLLALLCRSCTSDWRREASSTILGPSSVPMFGRKDSFAPKSSNITREFPLKNPGSLLTKSDLEQMEASSDVEKLFAAGEGSRAAQVAQEAGLWSLALIIASTLDRNLYMKTISEFAKANLNDGSALQMLCLTMAENDEEIIRRATSDSGLSEWRKTVGMLLTARNSSMPSTDMDGLRFLRLVEQLGDALISRKNDIVAGQVCLIISGRISTLDSSKVTILGADMNVPAGRPRSCGSTAAILQSLVFEVIANVQRGESFPHILPFRLFLSEAICAAGRPEIALKHCESISNAVRVMFESERRHLAAQLFTPPFLARLETLEQMLQLHLGLKGVEKKSKLATLGLSLSAVFKSAGNEREPEKTKRSDSTTLYPHTSIAALGQGQLPVQPAQFSQHVDYPQPNLFPHHISQPLPTSFAPMVDNTVMQRLGPVTGDAHRASGGARSTATIHSTPTVLRQQNLTRTPETISVYSNEQKTSRNERLNSIVSKTIGVLAPADGDLSPPPRTRSSSNFPMNTETASSFDLGPGTGARAPGSNLSASHMRSASTGDVPMSMPGYWNMSNVMDPHVNYANGRSSAPPGGDLTVGNNSDQVGGQTDSHGTAVLEATSAPSSANVSHRHSTSAMTTSVQTSERRPPRPPRHSPAASTSAIDSSQGRAIAPRGWKARIRERIISALRGPPQAHLGDESKFTYDKERGRWIIEGENPDEEDDVPPPPPDDDTVFGRGDEQVASSVSYDNLQGEILGSSALPRSHSMQDSRLTRELDSQDSASAVPIATHNSSHQSSLSRPLNQMLHGSAANDMNGGPHINDDEISTSLMNSAPYVGKGSHSSSPALPSVMPNRYRAHTSRRSGRRAYVDTFNKGPVPGPSVSAASVGRPVAPGMGGLGPRPGGFNVFTPSPAPSSGTDLSESSARQGSVNNQMSFSRGSNRNSLTPTEDHVSSPLQPASGATPRPYDVPLGSPRMRA